MIKEHSGPCAGDVQTADAPASESGAQSVSDRPAAGPAGEDGAARDDRVLLRTVRFLTAQNRLTEAILAQEDLAAIGAHTVETIREELRISGAALAVQQSEAPVFELVYQRGCDPRALAFIDGLNLRAPGPSPGKDAVLARRILVVPMGDAHAALCPVMAVERPVGVLLAVFPQGQAPPEESLRFIEAIDGSLGRALDGALRSREFKKSREVLERLNRESREMVRSLSEANEKLKELDRMKDSFVSSVSHELRTPLTSIRGFAEILLDYGMEDPAVSREFLTIIRDESERLGRLIRNILDLSRIEAGKMVWDIGPVDLEEIVTTAASVLKPQIEGGKRRFTMTIPADLPAVRGDRDGLVQVLVNLLGNAAKFTRPGGTISVTAGTVPGGDGASAARSVRLAVTDDGIGIPATDLPRLFEKFRQVGNPASSNPNGTGLGLVICREILSQFGGTIEAESVAGKGTVFRVTLPAEPRLPRGAMPDGGAASAGAGRHGEER